MVAQGLQPDICKDHVLHCEVSKACRLMLIVNSVCVALHAWGGVRSAVHCFAQFPLCLVNTLFCCLPFRVEREREREMGFVMKLSDL